MPTNVKVKDLKINTLTEAQYDAAVQSGVIGENEISILTDIDTSIQVSTMPAASSANEDKIYQYVGETTANYTNGYFYKCSGSAEKSATASQTTGSGLTDISVDIDTFEIQISTSGSYDFMYDDWEGTWTFHSEPVNLADYGITYTGTPNDWDTITVVYSTGGGFAWNRVDVQPAPVIPDPLPSQTGNAGKFLTTDGTDASWSDKPLVNKAELTTSVIIDALPSGGSTALTRNSSVSIGYTNTLGGAQSVAVGAATAITGSGGVAVGYNCAAGSSAVAIGRMSQATANYAIQLGGDFPVNKNTDANTFKVGNANGNYEIMSADGTIPTDRFTTTPSADGTYYPTLSISSGTPTRSWGTINALQNTATATSALTILGTANTTKANAINIGTASVVAGTSDIAIGNKAKTYSDGVQIAIGYEAEVKNNSGIAIGAGAKSLVTNGVSTAIGAYAQVLATGKCGLVLGNYGQVSAPYAIEINASDFTYTNSEEGTLCVGLRKGSSGANYKLMDSDGTVPTARLTKVNTTITLAVADWSSNTQTVNVTGMTATGIVFVSPDPSDQADYTSAGILCTAQAAGTLTFTCSSVPANDIDVVVVML